MRKVITEELKSSIRNFYRESPKSFSQVSEKFGLCLPTISKILKNENKYLKAQIFNQEIIEDYFSIIDSECKAYFLGLIIADGNVFLNKSGNRQASISITLDSNDKYILEKFKKELKTNTAISNDGRGCSQIAVRSNKMAIDLSNYGVVSNKSLITYLPLLTDDKFMPHLVRGIMDGDGSIFMKETDKKFIHAVSFCGSDRLMNDLSSYLYYTLLLSKKPSIYKYSDRNLSEIKIQRKDDILKYGNWIYKDSSIYLLRKRETYNLFLEHYSI
jgi:hypothetical protein